MRKTKDEKGQSKLESWPDWKEPAGIEELGSEELAEEAKKGRIYLFTGNGKGKTTAAMGLAMLRALGGGKVCVVQFLKGGGFTGEFLAAEKCLGKNVEFHQVGKPTIFGEDIKEGRVAPGKDCFVPFKENRKYAKAGLALAKKAAESGKYALVVLDEICVALSMRLLKLTDVAALIRNKHPETELVMTGRNAPKKLLGYADVRSEMREIKHPFRKGIGGRLGVDY